MAATLAQIYNAKVTNADLKNRVTAAIWKNAYNVMSGASPTAAQIAWAKDTIANATNMADQFMAVVVGVTQVQDANFNPTDTLLQTVVDAILAKYAV